MKDFAGKTAFVTGGASGIGRALATAFGERGMNVVIADVEEDALGRTAAELRAADVAVEPLVVDVADRAAVEAAAARTVERFGKVHVLCNNAGVVVVEPVDAVPPRDWDWIIDVNLRGVIHGMEVFAPIMIAQREGGHVVNTASIAGLVAMPTYAPYCATKFGVVGASEAWRAQLAPHGIGVSVLCPGAVATNIFDSRRNRASSYGDDDAASRGVEEDRAQVAAGVPPAMLANYVLESIERDEPYIISHGEFRSFFERFAADVYAGFTSTRASASMGHLPAREVPGFRT